VKGRVGRQDLYKRVGMVKAGKERYAEDGPRALCLRLFRVERLRHVIACKRSLGIAQTAN